MSSIMTMGGKRRWHWSSSTSTSTSVSTTDSLSQIKEMASQLSLHPHIHNFFRDNVTEDGTSAFRFECNEKTLGELGEVVAAQQPLAIAKGCREAVALALCALPCGNHFTKLWIDGAARNSGTEPFLALLADSNTCGLKELRIGNLSPHLRPSDWLSREADWKLLVHLTRHNTTLKSLRLQGCLDEMNQEGGIALAHSIQNNRGLEDFTIWATVAFGKERGGLALAAMVRHNSTLRTLDLQRVPLSPRGTDALAKALAANQGLRELRLRGTYLGWTAVTAGRAIVKELSLAPTFLGPSTSTLESLELEVDPPAADAMILLLSGALCANFCRGSKSWC